MAAVALRSGLYATKVLKVYEVEDLGRPGDSYHSYGPLKAEGLTPRGAAFARANRLADGYEGWRVRVEGRVYELVQVIPWRSRIVRWLMPELKKYRETFAYTVRRVA